MQSVFFLRLPDVVCARSGPGADCGDGEEMVCVERRGRIGWIRQNFNAGMTRSALKRDLRL